MGVVVALSRQLARRSAAQAVVDEALREDAAASLDAGYCSDTAESAEAHAGLLNSVSQTGSPSGDVTTDLAELAEVVSVGSSQVVFVTGPGRARRCRFGTANERNVKVARPSTSAMPPLPRCDQVPQPRPPDAPASRAALAVSTSLAAGRAPGQSLGRHTAPRIRRNYRSGSG
jgi:hypothetical protein